MTAQWMDGKAVAEKRIAMIRDEVSVRLAAGKRAPALAVILLGNEPASALYVRNKKRACERARMRSVAYDLPDTTTQHELLAIINQLNTDITIDGILVQLPLPSHIDAQAIIECIDPRKDVDGFHPYNIGRLAVKRPLLRPCTPLGIMTLLAEYAISIVGKKVVIVGASTIVGRPQALEMLLARATVTVCHSATLDLAREVAEADIIIAAVGRPAFIRGEWIKPGAVVIDVGINRLDDGRLCGDVDFATACQRAALITPVPGGVGPMTVATLLENTLLAANLQT